MRRLDDLALMVLLLVVGTVSKWSHRGTQWLIRKRSRLRFQSRPGDVYIATYPRSGTTWMQMILFQLRTQGRGEFGHILQVAPYLDELMRLGRMDYLDRLPSPRLIKTHLPYEELELPSDAKCIFVTREPADTFISCFHHAALSEKFHPSFPGFFGALLRGGYGNAFRDWFEYMRGWMPHRHDANVLWVRYEDLRADLEGQVRRIAAFCGLPLEEERMGDILHKCGFEYMKQHDAKFDFRQVVYDAPERGGFIRRGGVGSERERQFIRPEHSAALQEKVERLRLELGLRETERF